jgi:uncharacterized protein (DUF983 family)
MTNLMALFSSKCPRCHKGDMFTPAGYLPFQKQKMKKDCDVCGLHYEIEAGFFWGAMYLSYALNVAESLTLSMVIFFLTGSHSPWLYSGIIVFFILLFNSFNFRYGRVLMLYLFGNIRYEGDSF